MCINSRGAPIWAFTDALITDIPVTKTTDANTNTSISSLFGGDFYLAVWRFFVCLPK